MAIVLFGIATGIVLAATVSATVSKGQAVLSCPLESEVDYENMKSVSDIVEAYHKQQNDYLNKKIKAFVTAENISDVDKLPAFDEDGLRGECDKKSTATLCVARAMLREFAAFKCAIQSKRGSAALLAQQKLAEERAKEAEERDIPEEEVGDHVRFTSVVQKAGEVLAEIDSEVTVAEKTLDLTLDAYNELHMALPLHRKYQLTIKSLEKYRDELSVLRRELELYPGIFHDLTTSSCT